MMKSKKDIQEEIDDLLDSIVECTDYDAMSLMHTKIKTLKWVLK